MNNLKRVLKQEIFHTLDLGKNIQIITKIEGSKKSFKYKEISNEIPKRYFELQTCLREVLQNETFKFLEKAPINKNWGIKVKYKSYGYGNDSEDFRNN